VSDLIFDPSTNPGTAPLSAVEPVDAAMQATNAAPTRWTPLTRLGFRFAFCYFMLYALCCGNATLWEVIPFGIGDHLEEWLAWPFRHGAQWLSLHALHLTGIGAKLHGGGSGDRALDWIAVGIMLALAIVATLVWSLLDRKRLAYPKLCFWFRLILRLTLGFAMLTYGMVKFFPLQMAPPSLAVLNEPLGNTSPMTMLWTLIGLSPVYEIICGAAEMTAGVLILFRRTALLGTLLTAFLTTNIVLYNFCFDVPVKIYAAHLLMMSLVLLTPWLPALIDFFILHKPCAPSGGWTSPARRYGLRIETVVTAAVLLLTGGMAAHDLGTGYLAQRRSAAHPNPFVGQWHVDSALLNGQPKPYLTNDGYPLTDIYLEPIGRTMLRGSDHALYRAGVHIDDKKHTFTLSSEAGRIVYEMQQPDPLHLTLTPTGDDAKTAGTLTLTRIPLPTHYPLLDRGFHFVNEWGLER
jgi:hypothetical protein